MSRRFLMIVLCKKEVTVWLVRIKSQLLENSQLTLMVVMQRLKRNFHSLGYYCTPNLSIHQNSTQELEFSSHFGLSIATCRDLELQFIGWIQADWTRILTRKELNESHQLDLQFLLFGKKHLQFAICNLEHNFF